MLHKHRGKKIYVSFQLIVENLEFSKLFRKIATAGDFVDFSSYLEKTLSRCQFSSTRGKEPLKKILHAADILQKVIYSFSLMNLFFLR